MGAGSNGINPLTEAVTLQIGTFSITVPAGSFTQQDDGSFVFEGTIGGVSLEETITPQSNGSFQFKAEGEGVDLTGSPIPVTVTLTIGDDAGSASVSFELGSAD